MSKKRNFKLVASMRCFFPRGAFLMSTKEMARIAREVGYDGIEFLPTWSFVYEMLRFGELTAPEEMVASGHRDWRFDRTMGAITGGKPWWIYQLRNKEDWLFPLSQICLPVLQKFQKRYKVPVSVSWTADLPHFKPVMLELWGKAQGFDYAQLGRWIKNDPENHGIVLDTAKFTSWLESNNLLDRKREIIRRLLPHIFEVHFRFKKKGREGALGGIGKDWGRLRADTVENYQFVLEAGYSGPIVVELGWPDVDESIVRMLGEDFRKFRKVHSEFVEKLSQL